MRAVVRTLHIAREPRAEDEVASGEDLGITLMILLVAALPLASTIAGVGRWDEATLGIGTVGVLLAGRELWRGLLARVRSRRRP